MKIGNQKTKYVISLILCIFLLIFSVTTLASNLKTTQTQVELQALEKDKINIRLKPEENRGVTSFQICFKVEEEKGWFNDNTLESITMEWNPQWNLSQEIVEGKVNIQLAQARYDKENKRIYIYVVSKTELTQEDGDIHVGTLQVKTKNEKDLTLKITTVVNQTYIVSPADQTTSMQVVMDETIGSTTLKVASQKEPEQNKIENEVLVNTQENSQYNETIVNSIENEITNTVIKNEIVNVVVNETIYPNQNVQSNKQTNEVVNEIQNTNTTYTNTQTNNSVKEQEENTASGKLPQTGTIISIVAIVIAILAIIGMGHSIYHLKKKS